MTNTLEIFERCTIEKGNAQHKYKLRASDIDVVVESISIDDQHVFEVMQGYTQECGVTAIDIPSTFVFDVVVSKSGVAEISVAYTAGDSDEPNRLTNERDIDDALERLQRDATVGSDEGLLQSVENEHKYEDPPYRGQRGGSR